MEISWQVSERSITDFSHCALKLFCPVLGASLEDNTGHAALISYNTVSQHYEVHTCYEVFTSTWGALVNLHLKNVENSLQNIFISLSNLLKWLNLQSGSKAHITKNCTVLHMTRVWRDIHFPAGLDAIFDLSYTSITCLIQYLQWLEIIIW